MKNSQKGFVVPLLIAVIALLVVGGGVYVYESKKAEVPAVVDNTTQQSNQVQQPIVQNNPVNPPAQNIQTPPPKVIPATPSSPVSISSISGPTKLNNGESGTWTVNASGQKPLTYGVEWGDEPEWKNVYGGMPLSSIAYKSSPSFSHTYYRVSSTGTTYTPAFFVKDAQGMTTRKGSPVNVGFFSSQTPKNIPKAHNAFGFDLIKSIKQDEAGKNIFISPSSIALALSMVYNGANGETKNAMQTTLHLQDLDISNINQESLGLINLLKNPDPKVQLSIANSVWARKEVNFSQNFIDTLKSYYNAESSVLDFANPNSVKTINSWVRNNTNGKIPTIVSTIPSDMVMYLINAVYFKGSWTKAFDKKLTQNKPFTVADGSSKSTPLMKQTGMLPYLETEDFQSVNLTYGGNKRISMYVFLPKNVDTFVTGLTLEKWNGWMSEYKNKSGVILLPKFKMDYEKQLKTILAGLGMDIAFSNNADLSGIGKDLKISEVKHKSYVDVNEEGTEAAAVTSVSVRTTSVAPPQDTFYMEVNHPFFFAIRDNQTEEVLFMGVVQNP